ncbi:MAG TPA: L,D-transpeptidase family protein [Bauldia sp.]|nr:L,D-transpeptidase family protein [Bauldia sp.]
MTANRLAFHSVFRSPLRALLAASAAMIAIVGTAPAAEDPIQEVLQNGSAEWSDGFDAASVGAADVRTSIPTLSPSILAPMQAAIAQYSQIAAQGGWPTVPSDKSLKIGMRDPAVAILRQRLAITGDLPREAGATQSDVFDSYVDAAVRRIQARHGIQPDGVVGDTTFAALNIPVSLRLTQLANNMTRLKAFLSKPLPPRYVMVNIPAASVEAVENGVVVQRHTAVVGKVDRPSPIVNSKITEINFHPYWTVPASIIKRDLIPLMQKDPTYLATWKIRIFDKKGQEIQPTEIDWSTDQATKGYMFKQDPGDENSLGIVKINFPSPEGVYMHDTPHKGTFNDDYRFDSSGCVRIQNVRELVTWILRDTPGQTPDMIESEFRNGQRLDVKVGNPVPLHWVYITAWASTEGIVNFRSDIYNLDGLEQYTAEEDGQGQPL